MASASRPRGGEPAERSVSLGGVRAREGPERAAGRGTARTKVWTLVGAAGIEGERLAGGHPRAVKPVPAPQLLDRRAVLVGDGGQRVPPAHLVCDALTRGARLAQRVRRAL